jgi:hypothetical protein
MSWVAVGTTALKIGSDMYSNSQNKKAAGQQAAGLQQGMDTIKGFYDDAKGYMQPYMNTGTMANTGIQTLLSGDYSGFYNSPDFKAAMQAGGDMLDNSAASRGGLFGGGQQRALTGYGQQLASQYLGNYRNWLGGVAGQGQQAATGLGQLGMGAGNSIANIYAGMGNAKAGATQANGMNGANMIGSIGSMAGSLFGGK